MTDTIYFFIPKLTILGVLDADNYTPILLLLFILAKPNGGRDGLWFTLGVVLTQLAGGFLFLHLLSNFDADSRPFWRWLAIYGQIILGVILVLTGLRWRPSVREENSDTLENLGHRPIIWFSIGVFVEITKLLTAVVYVDAVRRILSVSDSMSDQLLLVLYFNLVAFSPMIVIWIIYLSVGVTSPSKMIRLRRWVVRREPTLIRFALVAVGVFLIYNGYTFIRS